MLYYCYQPLEKQKDIHGDTAMEYWIYHDKISRTARLHINTCRSCKNGKGMHGHQKVDENQWYKFVSKQLAIEAAERLNIKKPLEYCRHCKP